MNNKIAFALILSVGIVALGVFFVFRSLTSEAPVPVVAEKGVENETLIVAFGDSLTAGYGLPLSESYPAQLQVKLRDEGYSVNIVNAGVSGETTRGNLERAPFIRKQSPDIVLLGIGGNDALRFLPIDETRLNIKKTIELLNAGKNPPHIILLSMQAPLNAGSEYKKEFDALYNELATEYSLSLVPFITESIFLNERYKLQDGIHLNRDGYAKVIDDHIKVAVENILNK